MRFGARRRRRGGQRPVRPSLRFGGDNEFGPGSGIDDDSPTMSGASTSRPDSLVPRALPVPPRPERPDADPQRGRRGGRARAACASASPICRSRTIRRSSAARKREEITAGVVVGLLRIAVAARAVPPQSAEERDVWHEYGFVLPPPLPRAGGRRRAALHHNADAEDGTTFSLRVTFTNLGELSADSGLFGPCLEPLIPRSA